MKLSFRFNHQRRGRNVKAAGENSQWCLQTIALMCSMAVTVNQSNNWVLWMPSNSQWKDNWKPRSSCHAGKGYFVVESKNRWHSPWWMIDKRKRISGHFGRKSDSSWWRRGLSSTSCGSRKWRDENALGWTLIGQSTYLRSRNWSPS